ncbi:MAG: mannosylglycerate synthase domain-containing protein [Acidimicrobiia bacterium]
MSVVVFPFKEEDHDVVIQNVSTAADHPRITKVVCMGRYEASTFEAISNAIPVIEDSSATPVSLLLQERIGSMRPGKGDAMNTAMRYFLERSTDDRLHFYDADITSFDSGWIDKAESAADAGFEVVRHYFPRSSTDAMITWMITRTGFAMVWPDSELSLIQQPLGGELLFTRRVVERLVADQAVRAQSDWGIDTLFTFATIRKGFSVFETYVPQGKIHKLYGSLTDIRTMVIECFAALQGLRGLPVPPGASHQIETPVAVPAEIKGKVAYDFESTMQLVGSDWTPRQEDLLALLPVAVRDGMLAARGYPRFSFMDDRTWFETFSDLLDHFVKSDQDWEALLFRLWIVRVLQYTVSEALRGYDHAMAHLARMVESYRFMKR